MADNAERRLRELLHDPEWSLPPRPDAMARIRRTARRQRVKAAGTAACAAAAIASAAVAVPLTLSGTGSGAPPASQATEAQRVMPVVIGDNLRTAETIISAAIPGPHFTIRYAQGTEPAGTVIAQTPAGGRPIEPGSQITLVVCSA